MDTTTRRRKVTKVSSETLKDVYPHDVNLYTVYPTNEITLSEFQEIALERLQVLRIIEQAGIKGHKLFSEDWKKCVKEDLIKANLKKYVRLMGGYGGQSELDYQARRADHISHFVLRLAYCRSEELRRWFLSREMEWFRLRFQTLSKQDTTSFLQTNNLKYAPITNEEKAEIYDELIMASVGLSDVGVDSNDFYQVPFYEVCPLVKARKIYIKNGFAYIPSNDLVVCILSKFRSNLNEALNVASHRMPKLNDERLDSLLENLHQSYTGRDYSAPHGDDKQHRIDPDDLSSLSKKHFPLCMKNVHEVLMSTHHLKHFCRLQYGLFLKGIGLLYEDAMRFWRQQFTKGMDSDKFDKSYAYEFKHQYGKVGNMTNYSPYSCMKIITTIVGPGDCHGCPFKHWDGSTLKQKLGEYGLSSESVQSVADLAADGHFQMACTKYFESTHKKPSTNAIMHPNQYFEESIALTKESVN